MSKVQYCLVPSHENLDNLGYILDINECRFQSQTHLPKGHTQHKMILVTTLSTVCEVYGFASEYIIHNNYILQWLQY